MARGRSEGGRGGGRRSVDGPLALDGQAVADQGVLDVLLAEAAGVVLDIEGVESGGEIDALEAVVGVGAGDAFSVAVREGAEEGIAELNFRHDDQLSIGVGAEGSGAGELPEDLAEHALEDFGVVEAGVEAADEAADFGGSGVGVGVAGGEQSLFEEGG